MQQADPTQDPNYDEYVHVFDDDKTLVQPSNTPGYVTDISKKSGSSKNETQRLIAKKINDSSYELLKNVPQNTDNKGIDDKITKEGIDNAAHAKEHPEEEIGDQTTEGEGSLDGYDEFQQSLTGQEPELDDQNNQYTQTLNFEPEGSDAFAADMFWDPNHPDEIDKTMNNINEINAEEDANQNSSPQDQKTDIDAMLAQ